MLGIDIIGITISWLLVGIRYPVIVISATIANVLATIAAVIFLNGQLKSVVAAGAFTGISSNLTGVSSILVMLSGPTLCYLLSLLAGGIGFEPTANLINPSAKLKYPVAVIFTRFALISLLLNIGQYFL